MKISRARGLALIVCLVCSVFLTDAYAEGGSIRTNTGLETATFAGGCFWCMEPPFDKLEGVISTISGYTGGHQEDPTYQQVSAGITGHAEAVQIQYDPEKITYEQLLYVFWRNIDPTTSSHQFCDYGNQYRATIFTHNEEQKLAAQRSREVLARTKPFREPIVTEIIPASVFYKAEGYHQDFSQKNPVRYKLYRYTCGRDQRLRELWEPHNKPLQ